MMASGLHSRVKKGQSGAQPGASLSDEAADAIGSMSSPVDMREVRRLQTAGRLAMVVAGQAYDFTNFANEHPGGPEYLRRNAGKVATAEFLASHPVDIIQRTLTTEQLQEMSLGPVDPATVDKGDIAEAPSTSHEEDNVQGVGEKPMLCPIS